MIILRRSAEREHVHDASGDTWRTFFPQDHVDPAANTFGALIALDEMRLAPGAIVGLIPPPGAEMVTYLYKGALSQEDSAGYSGVIHTGEFQRMSTGDRIRHREANASRSDRAQIIRICLRPAQAGLARSQEQLRFTAGQRRNQLCVVASPDGRVGSMRIQQDALVYSSLLDPGHHLIHELLPERATWLHILAGEATMNAMVLSQGDGIGVARESSVSVTVQQKTEVLLVDLGPNLWHTRGWRM